MQTARGLKPSRAVLRRAAKGGKPSAIPIAAGRRVRAHQQKHPSGQGCRGSRGTAGEVPGDHQHQHSCGGWRGRRARWLPGRRACRSHRTCCDGAALSWRNDKRLIILRKHFLSLRYQVCRAGYFFFSGATPLWVLSHRSCGSMAGAGGAAAGRVSGCGRGVGINTSPSRSSNRVRARWGWRR